MATKSKLGFFLVLAASLFLSAEAQGQAGSKQERIESLLFTQEGMPTRTVFEEAASDAENVLFEIAIQSQNLWLRARALSALGLFRGNDASIKDARVWELYQDTLRSSSDTSLLAHRCLQVMSTYFPERMGATLRTYLRRKNLSLRHSALSALLHAHKRLPSTTRKELLDMVRADADPSIRKRLSRWLLKQAKRPSQNRFR